MKKSYILGAVAIVAASLTSCDDFLNDNRYPESIQVNTPEFWSNASNVLNETNAFYELFLGYGNGSSYGEFYFPAVSDDKTSATGATKIAPWKNINVPTSSGDWNTPYTYIRRANEIIEGVAASTLTEGDMVNATAIARMYRGYEYYMLVRAYGDVPYIDRVLEPTDEAQIFGKRVNRDSVMDCVLADLDYAIANIAAKKGKQVTSQDLARAIKSEVCLYEASYARYHAKNEVRAKKYYEEVVKAAESLVKDYPVGDDYWAVYNSFNGAALKNDELIFVKEYVKDVFMHCTVDYTSSSTPISGMTKDAFDAFLFRDGQPLATTTLDKNDAGFATADSTLNISKVLEVRDARLSVITDTIVYYTGAPYKRTNSMPMTSVTGYGVKKFMNPEMDYTYSTTIWNYTCAPLYWGAYVGLNYAEAKAELGTLTDADLDATLNKLFARAALPTQTVASLSAINDSANNMGVSSLLWEIRRCRRCELMFDKDIRYWDMVRWHQLDKLDNVAYPNISLGANIKNAVKDVDHIGDYINAVGKTTRVFEERQYLFPIPSGQIGLYIAPYQLEQQPLWK